MDKELNTGNTSQSEGGKTWEVIELFDAGVSNENDDRKSDVTDDDSTNEWQTPDLNKTEILDEKTVTAGRLGLGKATPRGRSRGRPRSILSINVKKGVAAHKIITSESTETILDGGEKTVEMSELSDVEVCDKDDDEKLDISDETTNNLQASDLNESDTAPEKVNTPTHSGSGSVVPRGQPRSQPKSKFIINTRRTASLNRNIMASSAESTPNKDENMTSVRELADIEVCSEDDVDGKKSETADESTSNKRKPDISKLEMSTPLSPRRGQKIAHLGSGNAKSRGRPRGRPRSNSNPGLNKSENSTPTHCHGLTTVHSKSSSGKPRGRPRGRPRSNLPTSAEKGAAIDRSVPDQSVLGENVKPMETEELSDVDVCNNDDDDDKRSDLADESKNDQRTPDFNLLELTEKRATTPVSNDGTKICLSDLGSVTPRGRTRGRPRSTHTTSAKKGAAINSNTETESTENVMDAVGSATKSEQLDTTGTPKVKTEQVTPKVGRIIRKPKIFSPDFEPPSPKKKYRKGKRSQTESAPEGEAVDVSGDIKKRETINPKWLIPFEHGWRREIVLRNTYGDKRARPADVYYYPPRGGPKLRSIPEICRHLQETKSTVASECFTFIKDLIHEEPSEVVRYASKYKKPFQKTPVPQKKVTDLTPVSKKKKEQDKPEVKSEEKSTPQPMETDETISVSSSTVTEVGDTATVVSAGSVTTAESSTVIATVMSEASKPIDKKMISSDTKNAVKQAVAKKHTGKRSICSTEEKSVNGSAGNLPKKLKTGPEQRLCGMDCPGRHGVPPSLHCTVCMCMFHPECIGKHGLQRFDRFVCKSCKMMNKRLRGLPPGASVSMPIPPPPLQITPSPNPALSCAPPPLRVAPSIGGLEAYRAPPPLRMAPVSSLPQVTPSPVALSSFVRLPTVQLPQIIPDIGCSQPISMLASVSLSTAITAPNITSIPSDLVMSIPTPAPLSISLPTVVPKDVSGQILSLPQNITDRLNLGKPVSIKVNQQNFVIPANCFMKTNDGSKVYLPDNYLPREFSQGMASPLHITLNDSRENSGQVIDVRTCKSKVDEVAAKCQKRRMSGQLGIHRSFIQHLHVGFDCMLAIFLHLELADLLRTSQVCKTWKRVATHRCLWRKVSFRGCRILDWEKAAKKLKDMHSEILDLRGMLYGNDSSAMWSQFVAALPHFIHLQHVDFGNCPGSLLHSIIDKVQHLEGITAEFIADTLQEPEMWTSCVKLDIGKFSCLKELKMLKLRGVCGLALPSFSFSGGLSEIGSLTKLKTLSLTTLREVPEDEFGFLGSLLELEELELGDIQHWNSETYGQIAKLNKLRSLRLECGTDYEEGGLGEALLSLEKLTNLELIKFTVSGSLVKNLANVKSLRTLSVWPDTEKQPAVVNTCTLRAVSDMKSLVQLEWGIMVEQSPSNGMADSADSNDSTESGKERSGANDNIPFFPASFDLAKADENKEGRDDVLERLTVRQLVNRLCDFLPDAKIRVLNVPVIMTSKT